MFLKILKLKRRNSTTTSTIDNIVKLNKNENLVKIELFLVNKYNLQINVRLCNNNRASGRRCKTLTKSNRNFLIRLNLTKRQINSYLVIKVSSSKLSKEIFEKYFSYILIANLHDRLKCEKQRESLEIKKKSKRFADEEFDYEDNDQQCRRVIQRVEFDKIFGSKNLIIQPSNYIAYKCEGSCHFKYSKFSTNHSTIQSLYNWLKPNSIERPCCVPVKYKPMYLLNYDSNNEIVMRQHENMIVDTCGCV